MSYAVTTRKPFSDPEARGAFGDDYGDQFAAGQYGVGSQQYYGRDSYAIPDSSGSSAPAASDSSGGGAESTTVSASSPTGGGGGAPAPDTTDSGSGALGGATLLVGLGAVAVLGYYLFSRGG